MSKIVYSPEELIELASWCTKCSYCRDSIIDELGFYRVCPVYEQMRWDHYTSRGRNWIIMALLHGYLEFSKPLAEVLYRCTTCGACTEVCKSHFGNPIDGPRMAESVRALFVERGVTLEPHERIAESVKRDLNPYREPQRDRTKWLDELDFSPSPDSEVVYFVGCTSAYRTQKVAINTAEILNKAGVEFSVKEDEKCCGSVLFRTGFVGLGEELAKENVEMLKDAEEVVFSCAGCYKTFKEDYPKIVGDLPFKIYHITEYIEKLLKEGKLTLGEVRKRVTYHDPCHLGRGAGLYDAPRNILRSIPGLEFVEMYPTKQASWCCGAGGGVKSAFPELAVDIAANKIRKVIEKLDIEAVVTACPFCEINLKDAIEKCESNLEVYDVTELIREAIKE